MDAPEWLEPGITFDDPEALLIRAERLRALYIVARSKNKAEAMKKLGLTKEDLFEEVKDLPARTQITLKMEIEDPDELRCRINRSKGKIIITTKE